MSPSPEEIIAYSKAFTESLSMENAVIEKQLRSIVELALFSIGQLASLVNSENSKQIDVQKAIENLQEQSTQSIAATRSAAAAVGANSLNRHADSPAADIASCTLEAINNSYNNTVTAQQNVFITSQAAATMAVSTIYSIGSAAIAARTARESAAGS